MAKSTAAAARGRVKRTPKPVVREQLTGGIKLQTYASIDAACNAQLRGEFGPTAELALSMMRDEDYGASIKKRVLGLVRSDLTIEPADGSNLLDVGAAELVQRHVFNMLPETAVARFDEWLQHQDVAVGVLDWHVADDGTWYPVLRPLSGNGLRFDTDKQTWSYTAKGGVLPVTPGDGVWVLASRWYPGSLGGFVSMLGRLWCAKTLSFRSWVDYLDNVGWPITKAIVPPKAKPEDKDAFGLDIHEARGSKTIVCPQGDPGNVYDVVPLGNGGSVNDASYSTFVANCGTKIAVTINGGHIDSESTSGGSYALAQVHAGNAKDFIDSDAQVLSTVFREQVLRPFIAFNTCGGAPPWPRWQTSPKVDPSVQGAQLNAFADFLTKISTSGFTVSNLPDLAQQFGLELKAKDQSTQ